MSDNFGTLGAWETTLDRLNLPMTLMRLHLWKKPFASDLRSKEKKWWFDDQRNEREILTHKPFKQPSFDWSNKKTCLDLGHCKDSDRRPQSCIFHLFVRRANSSFCLWIVLFMPILRSLANLKYMPADLPALYVRNLKENSKVNQNIYNTTTTRSFHKIFR